MAWLLMQGTSLRQFAAKSSIGQKESGEPPKLPLKVFSGPSAARPVSYCRFRQELPEQKYPKCVNENGVRCAGAGHILQTKYRLEGIRLSRNHNRRRNQRLKERRAVTPIAGREEVADC